MKITIERELAPGRVKATVVQVKDAGGGRQVILGSAPGKPDLPFVLSVVPKMSGSSYAIAAQALTAAIAGITAGRGQMDKE